MLDFVSFFINEKERKIKELIFPPTCILCGKININFICNKCYGRLKKYEKINYIRK